MRTLNFFWASIMCLLFSQCASTTSLNSYQPNLSILNDSLKTINNADIQKAFEANPQLTIPSAISVFKVGYQIDSYLDSLSHLGEVSKIFEIPSELFGIQMAYQKTRNPFEYSFETPRQINLDQLRLVSARAKTDILLITSISLRIDERLNNWGLSYFLLVPVFFAPAFDVQVSMQTNLLFIDVRNGFLYQGIKWKDEKIIKHVNPFTTNKHAQELLKEITDIVSQKITKTTKKVLTNKEYRIDIK